MIGNFNEDRTHYFKQANQAIFAVFKAWEQLPESSKSGRYDEMNRMWYEAARGCVSRKLYQEAFECLDQEMQYQYLRPIMQKGIASQKNLSGQNHEFFMDVITLESRILSHLNRDKYPLRIDHYFMPLHLSNGETVFVAIECRKENQEAGIELPRFSRGVERKTLYLLIPDIDGNYYIRDSVQFLSKRGTDFNVKIANNGASPQLIFTGITHQVTFNNSVPTGYVPVQKKKFTIKVEATGLKIVP